ncbi:Lipid-A-disaccharide synthase [hydrothermal vent metagenome]|uniref:lipid-A-disaccharide synthase n=1 Tax=hydrothermal vent metagenome TaxID=652676 RepID=A0A1W1C461_9ZZZZ
MLKIAISAAEHSGDLLASSLIKELKTQLPECEIFGLAGDKMIKNGCKSLWHLDKVSVMGFSAVLLKLPSLLLLRKEIITTIQNQKPNVFIGVDAPDFNFKIERKLRNKGIKTVHFVSPSVWAWRQKRIKKIKKSTDLVLCLFPFEVLFYQKHNMPAVFVGHPLADILKPRETYQENDKLLLMPGSRKSEIKAHLEIMLESAQALKKYNNNLEITVALVNDKYNLFVTQVINKYHGVKVEYGNSHQLINEADLVIVASGTATLEVALIATPMVVIYKMSWLSYRIAKALVKIPFVSLPNIILNKKIVPELIQEDATVKNIVAESIKVISSDYQKLKEEFINIHNQLKRNSTKKSAQEILSRI